jgi:hypothetical protein
MGAASKSSCPAQEEKTQNNATKTVLTNAAGQDTLIGCSLRFVDSSADPKHSRLPFIKLDINIQFEDRQEWEGNRSSIQCKKAAAKPAFRDGLLNSTPLVSCSQPAPDLSCVPERDDLRHPAELR